jgi:hypothetical protein
MVPWLALRTDRLVVLSFSSFLLLSVGSTAARAEQVLSQRSSWNEAHDFIYTDVTVRQDDGRVVARRLAGGVVGDVGMVQLDSTIGAVGTTGLSLDYLRSTSTQSGVKLRWDHSCVYITPDSAGTTNIAGDQEQSVITDVLHHWEQSIATCSYMTFVVDPPAPGEARYDGKNVIKFRESTWCRPASGMDPEQCYSPSAAAITTVFYVNAPGKANDGIIRDADVEINAVNFAVGVCSAPGVCQTESSSPVVSDLANTLTHEIGHLLGMDHTCWDQPGAPPKDDKGVTVPLCGSADLPPEVTEATMYNYQDSGEIKKATLEQDDIEGICAAYPLVDDPSCCTRALSSCDDGGSCAAAPPAGRGQAGTGAARSIASVAGFLVLLVGGLRAWRRRARLRAFARAAR